MFVAELFVNQHSSTLFSQITQAEKYNHLRVHEGEKELGSTSKVITFTFVYLVTANVLLF